MLCDIHVDSAIVGAIILADKVIILKECVLLCAIKLVCAQIFHPNFSQQKNKNTLRKISTL